MVILELVNGHLVPAEVIFTLDDLSPRAAEAILESLDDDDPRRPALEAIIADAEEDGE